MAWTFTTRPESYYGPGGGHPNDQGQGVLPLKAINPTPEHEEEEVLPGIRQLTWENGGNATRYDVFFKQDELDDFVQIAEDITSLRVNIPNLQYDTEYFWRVDAKNAYGTAEGDVWSFETAVWVGDVRALNGLTVWLSRSGDYDNFRAGVKDNDSFHLVIPSTNMNRWLGALESLLLGTAGDEWLVGSNKLETPLSPTNFKVKQQSEYGSSRIQPIKINSSLMFVDFVARKMREMTFVDPKYESPDLCALAEHITLHGITTIARQKNPDSIIWCTLGDGSLISMTYEREQDVVAWAKHPIDGFVQSVAVLPGTTEDTVYLSVERTINGADKVYLEKLASRVFETKADCHFADCGITVSVDDSDEITGLEHLAGEKVAVLAGGVVIYDGTEDESAVSELGVLTLPETITAAKVHIGLPYPSKLRPMRIIVGDSMGSHVRVAELVISLYNTGALKYGVNENNLIDVDLNDVRWNNTCKIKGLFTGEVVVSVPGGFDPLVPIFIVSDAPLPLTVRAIVPRIERTGR